MSLPVFPPHLISLLMLTDLQQLVGYGDTWYPSLEAALPVSVSHAMWVDHIVPSYCWPNTWEDILQSVGNHEQGGKVPLPPIVETLAWQSPPPMTVSTSCSTFSTISGRSWSGPSISTSSTMGWMWPSVAPASSPNSTLASLHFWSMPNTVTRSFIHNMSWEKILLETDSPYLPIPEAEDAIPSTVHVYHVADRVKALRKEVSIEAVLWAGHEATMWFYHI